MQEAAIFNKTMINHCFILTNQTKPALQKPRAVLAIQSTASMNFKTCKRKFYSFGHANWIEPSWGQSTSTLYIAAITHDYYATGGERIRIKNEGQ